MITTKEASGNLNSATDLFADCLAIPYAAEREGPHAATLGAIERLAQRNGATFASTTTIGNCALLPAKSVERHLIRLVEGGWIINHGRQHRRTATLQLTKQFFDLKAEGMRLYPRIRLPGGWAGRAVFSWIANAQLAAISGPHRDDDELSFELIRRRIKTIGENLGLSRNTTRLALFHLQERGWIDMGYPEEGIVEVCLADAGFYRPPGVVKSEGVCK